MNKDACGRRTRQTTQTASVRKGFPRRKHRKGCKITAEEPTAVQGTPVQEAQHLGWDVQTKCVVEVRTCRERPRAQVHQYSQQENAEFSVSFKF